MSDVALDQWIQDTYLRTVCGKCQVMVLEVQTHTRKVYERLDASLAELLRVTCPVSVDCM